jgi:hypothetical protein
MKLKRYWIYWGEGQVSCFQLRNDEQAKSIAKQYPNVTKIEKNKKLLENPLTNSKFCGIIYV